MTLRRLTSLEASKLQEEQAQLNTKCGGGTGAGRGGVGRAARRPCNASHSLASPPCPPAHLPLSLSPAHPYHSTHRRITDLRDLLQKRERILEVVQREADELVAKYGTPRRTAIVTGGARWVWCCPRRRSVCPRAAQPCAQFSAAWVWVWKGKGARVCTEAPVCVHPPSLSAACRQERAADRGCDCQRPIPSSLQPARLHQAHAGRHVWGAGPGRQG